MESKSDNMRTLFDPMIGEFYADTSPQVLDKFFNSKMRWRDDGAWYGKPQEEHQVNMLMTEQPPIIRGPTNPGTQNNNNNNRQPSDPSLIDYEAIDVYWRRDIELEKGMPVDFYPSLQYTTNGQGCSSSRACNDLSSEQFERDLQLLREKSLFTPLTHEENFRYENLSKVHYADFYRTVPSAAAKRWQSTSNSSSTSGYSNNTEQLRPPSPTKSNISSFDENEAANFFSNLAKQSMLEENRPAPLPTVQPQQPLQTYSNLTLCSDQINVFNNVSLANQANHPATWTNDTFFATEPSSSSGLRGSDSWSVDEQSAEDDNLETIAAQPLEISDLEAVAALSSLQSNEDLSDAVQLHEFIGMEMLGEFQRNSSIEKQRADSPIPETILNCLSADRETSPSSGIGSMQSSSSSPSHNTNEEFNGSENDEYGYRFYGKLIPNMRPHSTSFSTEASADSFKHPQSVNNQRKQLKSRAPTSVKQQQGGIQRKRGRQSKDEQLAQEHRLPASAEEFAAMSHMEIQSFMRDPKLTPLQKSLIKKIRRRGRNKVAARKCRERRTYPDSVSAQDQQDEFAVKEEMQSNYDPNDLSLYDF